MFFLADIPSDATNGLITLIYYLLVNMILIPDYINICSTK
jgi:hypothetical protein